MTKKGSVSMKENIILEGFEKITVSAEVENVGGCTDSFTGCDTTN